jgi:hypothetical protein
MADKSPERLPEDFELNKNRAVNEIQRRINFLVSKAYQEGVQSKRDRIYFILSNERRGLNYERGGRYCAKPYLQKTNQKIDFLDETLQRLGLEVKTEYQVIDNGT